MQPDQRSFSFDNFTLDLRRGCLRGAEGEIELRPKSFEVLRYLVENAGRLVPKDELIKAVWPSVIVTDESLARCVSDVRLALGDRGQRIIRTVPRRGYLLAVRTCEAEASAADQASEVVSLRDPAAHRASSAIALHKQGTEKEQAAIDDPAAGRSLPVPDKPSLAVLPFLDLSGDPGQDYFVDGMVEEIITALSRIRWLFVIARNSTFTYKGQAVDVRQVGRALGVRYVLEGSVRKAGDRVRITGQLIEAETGTHLWADRFDGSLADVFDLQDRVATSVAGVIEPTLQAAEAARSARRPTHDLTAYDLYLRAYSMLLATARQIPDALLLMEQAIARDPCYGSALAWAAVCCYRLVLDGRSEDPEGDRLKGADFARRALEVAGDDPEVQANAAVALAYFGEDIGAMTALIDSAVVHNPSFARGWSISSMRRLWAGQPDIAIEHAETALRLSPRARVGSPLLAIGAAHFLNRRFNDAVPKLLLAIQADPSFPEPYRFLAACYAHMGQLDNARDIIARLRSITPSVIPSASYLRKPEHRELFLSGLRLAQSASLDASATADHR
jgi:TolB-like protein/DNA-binding winged helix-turn-helix (wHTH) protein